MEGKCSFCKRLQCWFVGLSFFGSIFAERVYLLLCLVLKKNQHTVTLPDGMLDCYIAGGFSGWSFLEMNRVDETNFITDISDETTTRGYR